METHGLKVSGRITSMYPQKGRAKSVAYKELGAVMAPMQFIENYSYVVASGVLGNTAH